MLCRSRTFVLQQQAVFHAKGAISDVCQGHVVGYDDQGLVEIGAQFCEKLMDDFGVRSVEVSGGFIGENDFGLIVLGSCDGHALLFSAR